MPRVLRYAIRQNVKSTAAQTADGHERRKDFLGEPELAALLEAARKGRHGVRDYRDPKHTVHYTRVVARRFDGLWER